MARDKNADPLRRAGKHNDSTRQKYGHEHYEQIPLHNPNHTQLPQTLSLDENQRYVKKKTK